MTKKSRAEKAWVVVIEEAQKAMEKQGIDYFRVRKIPLRVGGEVIQVDCHSIHSSGVVNGTGLDLFAVVTPMRMEVQELAGPIAQMICNSVFVPPNRLAAVWLTGYLATMLKDLCFEFSTDLEAQDETSTD